MLLKLRLASELPKINAALAKAEQNLPAPIQPVAHHIFSAGGKRLRPFLTVLFAQLLNCREQSMYDLAITLEMLHAATLLHDDVLDNAPLRRGKPAAHTVFSVTETILAGDALLAAGNGIVADFDNPKLSRCFSTATTATCAGEIMEIHAQFNAELRFEQYIAIIKDKTAQLISCACEMGALVADADQNKVQAAAAYGENIGIAFQLVDDALDFAPESETGKPCGGDLREGKLTYPLRLYQESLPPHERTHFDTAFTKSGFTSTETASIAAAIIDQGFAAKTRQLADTYLASAQQSLAIFPDSSEKKLLLTMTDYIRDRKK